MTAGRNNDDKSSQTRPEDVQNALLWKLKEAKMPPDVAVSIMSDYRRMASMLPYMYEYQILRNYLELVSLLPWSKETKDSLDLNQAKKILEEDHYGLTDVKKRILEYLAVHQLKKSLKGPILCFVGPPGVGKTSIGRSIARALGRKFQRVSLGGICDQSDIRGHRRTYIGAMPGRIINGLKTAQTKNPVFLLDEIDKMTYGTHGDPSAALLEVLDPEQNFTFVDHYLNVPFDLSQVLFLATANDDSDIPAALYDRMEVINIDGYTVEEKVKIGTKYLIKKQMNEHGLTNGDLVIPLDTLKQMICKYTLEAGVRSLERRLGSVMRFVALQLAEKIKNGSSTVAMDVGRHIGTSTEHSTNTPVIIDDKALTEIFGPPAYQTETRQKVLVPGVAAGLCWTRCGGDLMYVETTKMDGDGKLKLTGQLGDVMQESVHIALNWMSCNIKMFNLHLLNTESGTNLLDKYNLHVHFPAGAVSKDGPSAGITVVVALVSLFTNIPMRNDTAMTGEITLRGQMLAVGGVKEKILAAYRNEFSRVILPKVNERDTLKLPEEVKVKLQFVFADRVEEALAAAFENGIPKLELPRSKL